jgi:hypothetical protein
MPPKAARAAEEAAEAPEVPAPPPVPEVDLGDFTKVARAVRGHSEELDVHYAVLSQQNRVNLSVAVAVVCLLVLLLIQDKEIQVLQKAVKALQG